MNGKESWTRNFAVIGVGGYVAPRHLKAIRDTGNRLLAAMDPHDAVAVLDEYFPDARYFTEIERFDRHIEKLRRGPEAGRIDHVSICSPNYLHDAHCRLALRAQADAICEKPLVINPWNLDALSELERETGRKIHTVLQLRLHPDLVKLHAALSSSRQAAHEVCLTYITARGPWYDISWKGSREKSGGLATNIGIHLFDLMLWLFGRAGECRVHLSSPRRMAGFAEFERARVRWFLSVESADLPGGVARTHRQLTVDGEDVEFSKGFPDLHTRVYEEILAGRGFGIEAVRPSIELAGRIRNAPVTPGGAERHPHLRE